MKQVFRFLTVLMLILVISASFAEEANIFSFRNGIHFGDSKEMVKAKEQAKPAKLKNTEKLVFSKLVLSGIEDSFIDYYFGNEDCLRHFKIRYDQSNRNMSNFNYHNQNYSLIEHGLQEKYGDPVEGDLLMIDDSLALYLTKDSPEVTFLKSSQRILEYDDDQQILIQHILANSPNGINYWHFLSYQIMSKYPDNMELVLSDL